MSSHLHCHGARTTHDQHDEPRWEPLLALLGEELTAGFMWMHEEVLDGATNVQAYKHRMTRRYLYLGGDGAYARTPCGRLAAVRVDGAVQACLCSWWLFDGNDEDRRLIRAAIEDIQSRYDMTRPLGWLD
jgi:hypothetical protein